MESSAFGFGLDKVTRSLWPAAVALGMEEFFSGSSPLVPVQSFWKLPVRGLTLVEKLLWEDLLQSPSQRELLNSVWSPLSFPPACLPSEPEVWGGTNGCSANSTKTSLIHLSAVQ